MKSLRLSSVLLAAALAGPALGGPIYMKFDGIDGESMAPAPGSIQVETRDLDQLERLAAQKAPRGGSHLQLGISSINFTKHVDRASPKLAQAAAAGKHIPRGVLTVRKAGGGQQDYLVVRMEDIIVSSFRPPAGGATQGTESVTINFAKADFDYHRK
ncbi:MAG: type VI secretion system tube protein Hcp, partial [Thermoanaerobaculia bacterium]|nr:type VI secretion system tube protein Hcp [Thermoanaerobaculia bacterium]